MRVMKVHAAGIALGLAPDPTVIVDEVAEFGQGARRGRIVVAIVVDDGPSLRRPGRDVLVELGRVGIHAERYNTKKSNPARYAKSRNRDEASAEARIYTRARAHIDARASHRYIDNRHLAVAICYD